MNKEGLLEDFEDWKAEVPEDVHPALFWYMKGFNSKGELGGSFNAGDRFEQARDRYNNQPGPGNLNEQYPEFVQYASAVFLERAKRRGVEPEAYIPDFAK